MMVLIFGNGPHSLFVGLGGEPDQLVDLLMVVVKQSFLGCLFDGPTMLNGYLV